MILVKDQNSVFFRDCYLLGYGCCEGATDIQGNTAVCISGPVKAVLKEDGYIYFEGTYLEIGLLRDYGGWITKEEYEDGTIYIYPVNTNGNGIYPYTEEILNVTRQIAPIVMLTIPLLISEENSKT